MSSSYAYLLLTIMIVVAFAFPSSSFPNLSTSYRLVYTCYRRSLFSDFGKMRFIHGLFDFCRLTMPINVVDFFVWKKSFWIARKKEICWHIHNNQRRDKAYTTTAAQCFRSTHKIPPSILSCLLSAIDYSGTGHIFWRNDRRQWWFITDRSLFLVWY